MSSRLCSVSDTAAAGGDAEVILPCQYYDLSGGERMSGEQRLMFALLVDAINVYQRGVMSAHAPTRRLYVDAEQWIMAYRRAPGVLDFESVCDAVGIDPTLLRRRLIMWKHTVNRRYSLQARLRLSVTPRRPPSGRRTARSSANAFIPM